MSCLNPKKLTVFPFDPALTNKTGKTVNTVFGQWYDYANVDTGELSQLYQVPCGKCSECLKQKRRDWSERLQLEASCYDDNQVWFITLTYDDDHLIDLPAGDNGLRSLQYEDIRKFIRAFRDRLRGLPDPGVSLRFFAAGEYGDKSCRPHFHVITFGPDLSLFGRLDPVAVSPAGTLYSSDFVCGLWPYGHNSVCVAGPGAISYVTGYVAKKLQSRDDYDRLKILPERCLMSTRPPIGWRFFQDNADEIMSCHGYVNPFDGRFHSIPRFALRSVFSESFFALIRSEKRDKAMRLLAYQDSERGQRAEIGQAAAAQAVDLFRRSKSRKL